MEASEDNLVLFKSFVVDLLEERYKYLGFASQNGSSENHITKLSRMSASYWMCKLNYQDCVENSQSYFTNWMTNRYIGDWLLV